MNGWTAALIQFGASDMAVRFEILREPLTERMQRAVTVTQDLLHRFASFCRAQRRTCGVVYLPDPRMGKERAAEVGVDRAIPGRKLERLPRAPGTARRGQSPHTR